MADDGDVLTDLDGTPLGANGADNQPAVGIVNQYVKDLSVENPNAPEVYQWKESPKIDLQFNIAANSVSAEMHEVELKITLTASADKGNLYIVELVYAGLVGVRNLPDEQTHAFLFAEAPRILFPFARRIVADAVRDAGFPTMLMEPVDFNGLYLQQMQAQQDKVESGEAPAGSA